jgi:hypothetical protein
LFASSLSLWLVLWRVIVRAVKPHPVLGWIVEYRTNGIHKVTCDRRFFVVSALAPIQSLIPQLDELVDPKYEKRTVVV